MTAGTAVMMVRMLAAWALLAAAEPVPLPLQQEDVMSDRVPLARLVEPLNAEIARMIRDPDTEVHRLKTPFLAQGLIFRIDWSGPNKPFSLTIGYARRDNFTVLLPANTAGFNELVAKAGVVLDSDQQRVALAVTELETTRRFDETFVVLRSFEDLRLMANPTEQDQQRFREIRQKYGPVIRLPRAEGGGPWELPIYVLSRNDLCLFTVTLDPSGKSTVAQEVLVANTPLLPAG